MAKISANGAHVVARLTHATRPELVITSDGRVLTRFTYSDGSKSGYTVAARWILGSKRAAYINTAEAAGYTVQYPMR